MNNLEARLQKTLLQKMVERYKRQPGPALDPVTFKKAVLFETLRSRPSIVLIFITILGVGLLLVLFDVGPVTRGVVGLGLLAGGGVAEIILLESGLRNERYRDQALLKRLRHIVPFQLSAVRDKQLKMKLYKALHEWGKIDDLTRSAVGTAWHGRCLTTHQHATQWLLSIYAQARRIDQTRFDLIRKSDLKSIRLIVQKYEHRLGQVQSPQQRRQLTQRLSHHQQRLQNIQMVYHHLTKAEDQLDQTLLALGTVYSQLLFLVNGSIKRQVVPRQSKDGAQRLVAEVLEEIQRLQDLTDAVEEVYGTEYA